MQFTQEHFIRSPSSRRAWIEILKREADALSNESPSSRRAWIEIIFAGEWVTTHLVALLAEGVD